MKIEDGVLIKVYNNEIFNGTIVIPEGVTSIGPAAFQDCSSLTSIKIPEGVTSIGEYAFQDCSSLTSIKIPEGVTSIGDAVFWGCSSLTSIKIPEGVTSIGDDAFGDCSSLTSVKIPEGVTSIGDAVFWGCSSLTSIKIPEVVTSIGEYAFKDCSSLTSIKIPEGVTSIGRSAFRGCSSLTSIKIPEGVTSIGEYAFKDCSNLTSIKISEGVTSIEECAFFSCISLNKIKLPSSLTNIGSFIFDDCSNLKEIEIPKDVNEEVLLNFYRDYRNICNHTEELMFGENVERVKRLKEQACFHYSEDYNEGFMDEIYHKIIFSLGIDELKNIVRFPTEISEEEKRRYILEKEEMFNKLYETKYKVEGDLGITLSFLKAIMLEGPKKEEGREEKNGAKIRILRAINQLLEEGEVSGLKDLVLKATGRAGRDAEKKAEQLEKSYNKKYFNRNIEKIRGKIKEALKQVDESNGEAIVEAQIEPITKMIEEELRRIYIEKSRIEENELRENLRRSLIGEERSFYVRQQADKIVEKIMNLLERDEEFKQVINDNPVEAIRRTKTKIGQGWIRRLEEVISLESIPEYFSREKIEEFIKLGIDVECKEESVLKGKKERENAYKLLEAKQQRMPEKQRILITYKQLHDMFGEVRAPYSEAFKEYFKKHREEFLSNPKYIYEFARICNNFDNIIESNELKNRYEKGNLELDEILGYLSRIEFSNQRKGEERLARLASGIGKITTDTEYEAVQEVFDIVRKRERTSIPPIYVEGKKYRGRMLSPNDILTMFAGNITDCCQKFGDVGMGSMLLGAIEENCGIFVVEEIDEKGERRIIGQSLVIRQKGKGGNNDRLTFDNVEIAENIKAKFTKEDEEEILGIYQRAGEEAIELDKKFLGKLLKKGKIDQKIYDDLVIKEVIAGRGYNDLNVLDRLAEAETIVPEEANYQYKLKHYSAGKPWIDSTKRGAPNGSNSYPPVILAKMDEREKQEIEYRRKGKKEERKSTLGEVKEWYGKVDEVEEYNETNLVEEQIERIKTIERRVYRKQQQLLNDNQVGNMEDIENCYGIEKAHVIIGSQGDWYIIYGESDDETITISDIALEGGMNSNKGCKEMEGKKQTEKEQKEKTNGKIEQSVQLGTLEIADRLYKIMIELSQKGKKIICNATADTSLLNIIDMLKNGLTEIYDERGQKIILDGDKKLVYEATGEEVKYRNWGESRENEEKIEMLDIEIRPNVERIIEEKKKIEKYLERVRRNKRMKGRTKEDGIEEMRRAIRNDLSER